MSRHPGGEDSWRWTGDDETPRSSERYDASSNYSRQGSFLRQLHEPQEPYNTTQHKTTQHQQHLTQQQHSASQYRNAPPGDFNSQQLGGTSGGQFRNITHPSTSHHNTTQSTQGQYGGRLESAFGGRSFQPSSPPRRPPVGFEQNTNRNRNMGQPSMGTMQYNSNSSSSYNTSQGYNSNPSGYSTSASSYMEHSGAPSHHSKMQHSSSRGIGLGFERQKVGDRETYGRSQWRDEMPSRTVEEPPRPVASRGSAFGGGRPHVSGGRDREDHMKSHTASRSAHSRPNSMLFAVEYNTSQYNASSQQSYNRGDQYNKGSSGRGRFLGLPDEEGLVSQLCSRFGEIRSLRKFGEHYLMVTYYDPQPVEMAMRDLNNTAWKTTGTIKLSSPRSSHHTQSNSSSSYTSSQHNTTSSYNTSSSYNNSASSYNSNNAMQYNKKPNRPPIGPTCSIWVAYEGGQSTEAIQEEELRRIFSTFGEIHSTKCAPGKLFSFVNFRTIDSAQAAYDAYNNSSQHTQQQYNSSQGRIKIKWGYPPPNHPLHNEISRLEDERWSKRGEFEKVTQPANNLFDRVLLAQEREREAAAKKEVERRRKADEKKILEKKTKALSLNEISKPRKKKAVVIGTVKSAGKVDASEVGVDKKSPNKVGDSVDKAVANSGVAGDENAAQQNTTQKHKADGFAKSVITLLNDCKGNWRDFVTELGRQKVPVQENSQHLFDLFLCGGIIEGPDTLYFPEGVKSTCCVFQCELSTEIELPGIWGSTRTGEIKQRFTMKEYAELFVHTRRRLRYTATHLESALVRYFHLAPSMQKGITELICSFIGVLLTSEIGEQGSTGLLFPLYDCLTDSRLTQQNKSVSLFGSILKTMEPETRKQKILNKSKLNNVENLLKLLSSQGRTENLLVKELYENGVALNEIVRRDELIRLQTKVAQENAKELFQVVSGSLANGENLENKVKNVFGIVSSCAVKERLNDLLIPCITAAAGAILASCGSLPNDDIGPHLTKYNTALKLCCSYPDTSNAFNNEKRELLILEALYDLCTMERESLLKEVVTQDNTAQLVEKVVLIIHALYDSEVLTEDAILKWFRNSVDNGNSKLKAKVKDYISWLEAAEEEDSEAEE